MDNFDPNSSGLGYSYTVLEQQVGLTLGGLVDKVLPLEAAYSASSSKSEAFQPQPGIRSVLENNSPARFEKALRLHQSAKEKACQAELEAQEIVKKVNETSKTIDLYMLALDALKHAVDLVPDPRHATITKTAQAQKSAPRSKMLSVYRKDSLADPSRLSFYSGRPPQLQRKTMRTKAPPPKPELRPVTEEEFAGISTLVRGKAKLSDVNAAYAVLFRAFVDEELEKLKLSELAKRGVGVSGMTEKAKLMVLRQLGRITLSSDQQFISPACI